VSLFGIACVGGGSVTTSVGFDFNPSAGAQVLNTLGGCHLFGSFLPSCIEQSSVAQCLDSGGSAYDCVNLQDNPVLNGMLDVNSAVQLAQNPCSSNSSIALAAFGAAVNFGGIVGPEEDALLPELDEGLQVSAASTLSITASDGTEISGFTFHGINRVIGDGGGRAGVTPQALLGALQNPISIREGVDDLGRPFKIYTGQDARVVVNPATGKVVSVNPLSGAGANR
jgi:hypothetical protein